MRYKIFGLRLKDVSSSKSEANLLTDSKSFDNFLKTVSKSFSTYLSFCDNFSKSRSSDKWQIASLKEHNKNTRREMQQYYSSTRDKIILL